MFQQLAGAGLISLLFTAAMCVHVVRTGRELFWLFIILLGLPPLGGIIYLVAVVLPELFRGPGARKLSQAVGDTLDPEREYRQAKQAVEDTPTVHNKMRLAAAAAELDRHDEAEQLYRDAAQGIHADDPALLHGRARALVELGRHQEALDLLAQVPDLPLATLTRARALEGLQQTEAAEKAYQSAVERAPGLEAIARYAAFQAHTGRQAQARETLAEIDKRVRRATSHFRGEARRWRDFAAKAID
jgi:hypothetical protein